MDKHLEQIDKLLMLDSDDSQQQEFSEQNRLLHAN